MLSNCLKTDNLPLTIMGLCPLLIVATSLPGSVMMGGMFFTALLLSSLILTVIGRSIHELMRLPIIVLVTACVAAVLDLLLSAYYYEWHLILGIYIPLLSVNCLILMNAEENVFRYGAKKALVRNLLTGLSVCCVLIVAGLIRDIMSGLIFNESGFVIFAMAPGAFLVLGFIMALIQYINIRTARTSDLSLTNERL